MKLPLHIASTGLALWIAAIGCDARPKKPMNAIPKAQPATVERKSDLRAEFEAANRPKPAGQPNQSNTSPNQGSSQNPSESRPSQVTKPQPAPKPVEPVADRSGSLNWLAADGTQTPMEYWEVQYFNAKRIGITRYLIDTEIRDKKDTEKRGLKIRMETKRQFVRGTQPLRQLIVIETHEQFDGRLDQFMETLTTGAVTSRTDATTVPSEMRAITETGERITKKNIPWPAGSWGPLGIHQMLMRKPMVPGEARQANVFLPQMHQLAHVTLVAGKTESTTSPEGLLADVVPIDVVMQLEKEGIRVRMWADAVGRVQKTIWPEGLNLSSFRISREMALKLQAEDEIESFREATLACNSPDLPSHQSVQAQYTISSEQADPHNRFSQQSNQSVKPKPVYETIVTVLCPTWSGAGPDWPHQVPPTLKDLISSTWLPSENPQIDRLAKQWVGSALEPLDVAKALLEATHKNLRKLEFAPTLHSAEVVAQSLEGDCTEHAMILAALLRNRQIASRIASGVRLVERDGKAKFEYHMWTEAWLNECWTPMDATTGHLTNCTYLKFTETSLAETDPYEAVLTVLRNLKPMKIDSVSSK